MYSYDEQKRRVEKGYPKPVENVFPGMTGKVTAAFQYKGMCFVKWNTFTFIHLTAAFIQIDLQTRKSTSNTVFHDHF